MLIADSQIHVWEANSPEHPWPNPAAGHRPAFPASEAIAAMNDAGVERAVLIPPRWDGRGNDTVLQAVKDYPSRFAIMGYIPMEKPAPQSTLDRWKEQPGMLGLRLTFTNDYAMALTDGMADWVWPAAEKASLPIMVFPPTLLRHFGGIAERHPNLRIIIDHMALPSRGKKDDAAFEELPDLLALARYDNIAVKASAVPGVSTEAYPFRNTHRYLRSVFDAFGPRRMFWGSDLTRLPCSYPQAMAMFTEELPWLTGKDKDFVMGQGLCDFIGWSTSK